MKKIFVFITISFLNMSCSAYKTDIIENQLLSYNNENILEKKVEIIPIPEMENIPEIDDLKFNSFLPINSKNINMELDKYQADISKLDLVLLSKWAKEEMKNYKMNLDLIKNYSIEKFYNEDSKDIFKIKLSDLPSHSPLVKRSLYIYPIYLNQKLQKIYITIQGIVEE